MNGYPMHWRQDTSGSLSRAVIEAFYSDDPVELEGPEILTLKDYLLAWIGLGDQLPKGIPEQIANSTSADDFQKVAMLLRAYRIDPIYEAFICIPCREGWHRHEAAGCSTTACSCSWTKRVEVPALA